MRESPSQRQSLKQSAPKTLYPDLERPIADLEPAVPATVTLPPAVSEVPRSKQQNLRGPSEAPLVFGGDSNKASSPLSKTLDETPKSISTYKEKNKQATVASAVGLTSPEQVGVVICALSEGILESTIKSLKGRDNVVVVTSVKFEGITADRKINSYQLVELSDIDATLGRARNAGYRHLKKSTPELRYVQFLEAGEALDPDWLAAAARHLDRRPELSAVEGKSEVFGNDKSMLVEVSRLSSSTPSGEVQACASTAMFRADAFEAAGGFRGDIAVNETEDLCIRLRRRGGHIWRIEAPMSFSEIGKQGVGNWWLSAMRNGYSYAVGAALHGAPPERFRVTEQARAIMWGFVFPMFIVFTALVFSIGTLVLDVRANPVLVGSLILSLGVGIYAMKMLILATNYGLFRFSSWFFAFFQTLAYFPEFIGIARYWALGKKNKRARKVPA